jgi:hypothetical protein
MVTKLLKKVVKPISSPALSSSGFDAVKPVSATNPAASGPVRCDAALARPRPANERKMMSAREEKLMAQTRRSRHRGLLRISCAGTLSSPTSAQNRPASTISRATRMPVRKATSPASSPKPESM